MQKLFLSVHWESGNYPEKLVHAMHNSTRVISAWDGDKLVGLVRALDDGETVATVYKGNIIKNLIMDCQSYTKYRPNETTGGIFVSWRRKEELPTGA